MAKTYIDELAEEIATLREENERLKKWMKKWVEVFNNLNSVKENKRLQIMVNNRDNAVTDLTKENQKLKELLIDFTKRMEHYKEVKPDVGFIMFDLGYLANQVKEVLK